MDFLWFLIIIPATLAWILFFFIHTVEQIPQKKHDSYMWSGVWALMMFCGIGAFIGECDCIIRGLHDKDRWEKPVVLKQIEEDGTQYALIREGNNIKMMNLNVYFGKVIPKDAKIVAITRVYGPYVGDLYYPQTTKYEIVK